MLDTFFEALYNKVLVNIVVKRSSTDVYIEICSKKGVVEQVKESFDTIVLGHDLAEFIDSYTKESPFFYISFLDHAQDQGAIPTCEKNRLGYYRDLSASEYKCYDKKWTYYTSKTDLYALEKRYEKIGVDFVFSPYLILNNFFKDKISSSMAMYILIQDSFVSLVIFDKGTLLYAQHLDMETTNESEDEVLSSIADEDVDLEIEQNINLEDVDVVDVMDDLDDFGDIEDLDSIEDIDEFSEHKDLEEELFEAAEEVLEDEAEDSFNEDYQRFSLIQTSLSHFYNDEKYESQFVETVYIADGVGVSSDLKHYLEEEMFLNVYLRRMDISMEVCEVTKRELAL